nr:squalene/phytoene synthase family protein [Nannocystis sp. RBIL2]
MHGDGRRPGLGEEVRARCARSVAPASTPVCALAPATVRRSCRSAPLHLSPLTTQGLLSWGSAALGADDPRNSRQECRGQACSWKALRSARVVAQSDLRCGGKPVRGEALRSARVPAQSDSRCIGKLVRGEAASATRRGGAGKREERPASDLLVGWGVPLQLAHELISGVRADAGPMALADDAGLLRHGYQVAGAVGLIMCGVIGARDPLASPFALDLGIALYLTHIARRGRRARPGLPAGEPARIRGHVMCGKGLFEGSAAPAQVRAETRQRCGEQVAVMRRRCGRRG